MFYLITWIVISITDTSGTFNRLKEKEQSQFQSVIPLWDLCSHEQQMKLFIAF